ncbi:MAG: hypothetical protein EPN46_09325 [Candidimonas sp.]|nr:MAG: hypothetical protein EPN77_01185 [Candidimonas sp.]TAM24412.1 MAG: hypothetical protein EPN62_06840 [Candidimonas sp.]TAM76026.1 MAG: hypothetical protein EPN46_09325 [Candidimonas sp.]
MQIVLPGALPDPSEARELAPHVLTAAPTLSHWLRLGRASTTLSDPAAAGCTCYEHWLLSTHGFKPAQGQNLSAGLGPLWAGKVTKRDQPVWLAELVHVAPSRDGARLFGANDLSIEPAESAALFDSAQDFFKDSGFSANPLSTQHWRITIDGNFAPVCSSPGLVSLGSMNDSWPKEPEARPWRRLVNELQMLWFDHPVNLARQARGLASINSLWLFGGARADQFADSRSTPAFKVYEALHAPFNAHDWSAWLQALSELESTVFEPLARTPPELTLIGRDRFVQLRPSTLARFTNRLPGKHWSNWWSPRN